jgi:dTDP-4-dehydrorhamnose 3,5-epimerase
MIISNKLTYKKLEIKLKNFSDIRGEFIKVYDKEPQFNVKQINISRNKKKGTVRGIHFQNKPFQDAKFVMCIKGKIFDVVVDLRKKSKTFKKWKSYLLEPNKGTILYIPRGFGHAFQTLAEDTEVMYIHDNIYSQAHEGGVNYLDDQLKIQWPLKVSCISNRDKNFSYLS